MGKTTNLEFIQRFLHERGIDVLTTREPGGTRLSESIRRILLDKHYAGMHPDAELLLVFAARAEHLNRRILPALKQGRWVLSDRFTDASFAYQGAGRNMGFSKISILEQYVQRGFQPDLTLLLDADIKLGLSRVEKRSEKDRFEDEHSAFFQRVRDGYLQRAGQFPDRIKIINAERDLESVQADIAIQLKALLDKS